MRAMCVVAAIAMTAGLGAQETTAMLPGNYQVQFENEWVKVTSVRYGPNEKLPGHAHTPTPTAYVYLNDGGPVIFRHVGGSAATRPATKAGAFRVYRGLTEVHEVENTAKVPSEFLRVELKTEPRNVEAIRGKFERPAAPTADAVVHFDHPQVRISRLWAMPGSVATFTTGADPALVIALMAGGHFTAGQVRWVPASSGSRLDNPGTVPIDFLRFDFKTPPSGTTR